MSIRALRILLLLTGITFVGLTAWSLRFFGRYQPFAALTQTNAGSSRLGLQAGDVLVIGHESGQRRWRMAARSVMFSRDRRSLSVDGIRQGLLYDRRNHPLISLTAGHAVYQTPFGMVGIGSVGTVRMDGGILATVLTPDKPILQTQALVWDAFRNTLNSSGPVSVALPRLTVKAGNASFALPSGGWNGAAQGTLGLGGGIQAVLHSPQGQITLACPGLTWNGGQASAYTQGRVSAQMPGNVGAVTAGDMAVNTRTGDVTGHGIQGTMRLSGGVL